MVCNSESVTPKLILESKTGASGSGLLAVYNLTAGSLINGGIQGQ